MMVTYLTADLVDESPTHIRVRLDHGAEPVWLPLSAVDASAHDPLPGTVSLVIPEALAREMGINTETEKEAAA